MGSNVPIQFLPSTVYIAAMIIDVFQCLLRKVTIIVLLYSA